MHGSIVPNAILPVCCNRVCMQIKEKKQMNIRRVVVRPSAPVMRSAFLLALIVMNFAMSQAAHVLDAYRLAQFDKGMSEAINAASDSLCGWLFTGACVQVRKRSVRVVF